MSKSEPTRRAGIQDAPGGQRPNSKRPSQQLDRVPVIILDSNSIFQYPNLDGLLTTFLQEAHNMAVRVYVPDVVIDELVCCRERELRNCLHETRRILGKLRKLVGDSELFDNGLPSIQEQMTIYTARLHNTLICNGNAERIPYPDVGLSRLVKDAGLRVTPFDSRGNNFRDYLIWCSVKFMVSRDVTIHFVSGDRKAFGKSKLLDSLADQVPDGKVCIHPDIGTVMEQIVTPKMQELETLRSDLENNKICVSTVIEDRLDALIEFKIEHSDSLNIPQESLDVSVEEYGTPENVSVVGTWKTGEDTALIAVEFDVECQLEFFVDKFEAVHSDDWEEMSVYDLHWNKAVAHVGANRILEVSAYLEIDFPDLEPGSLKVVHVTGKDRG